MSTKSKKSSVRKSSSKTMKSKRTKTLCISHMEDADGISSAALIKQAFGGDTILVDYPGMTDVLETLRNDEKLKTLFICDLGLNKQNTDYFVELLTELRKKKISITYVDHHHLDSKIIAKLKNDYMEDRPIASKLLQIYDRQFALISATVLTYNIVGHQRKQDVDYLHYLVDELSESKFPHDIPNTYEFAQIQVGKLAEIISKVKASMKISKNLGHMEVLDSGASGAANFVLGFSGKDVAITYKERVDKGIYAVSVRGSPTCKTHLGKLVSAVSSELGGSGGGHDKACGAVIPKDKIKKFLREMNSRLGSS